jgi:hypothetical protein
MKDKEDIVQITIRVPAEIKEKLKDYYWRRGMDLSNGIRSTLYRLLEQDTDESR